MNEVKKPKKPLMIYYALVLIVLLLINMLLVPYLAEKQVKEVDYGTFMEMTENKEIGQVEISDNEILFTDKSGNNYYKTGVISDDGLVDRLYRVRRTVLQRDRSADVTADESAAHLDPADGDLYRPGTVDVQKAHAEDGRHATP